MAAHDFYHLFFSKACLVLNIIKADLITPRKFNDMADISLC